MPTQKETDDAKIWALDNTDQLIELTQKRIVNMETQLQEQKDFLTAMLKHKAVFDAEVPQT